MFQPNPLKQVLDSSKGHLQLFGVVVLTAARFTVVSDTLSRLTACSMHTKTATLLIWCHPRIVNSIAFTHKAEECSKERKVGTSLLPNMVHILKHTSWSGSKGIFQINLCQGTTVAPLASSILKVTLTAFELVRMKLTLGWRDLGACQMGSQKITMQISLRCELWIYDRPINHCKCGHIYVQWPVNFGKQFPRKK